MTIGTHVKEFSGRNINLVILEKLDEQTLINSCCSHVAHLRSEEWDIIKG